MELKFFNPYRAKNSWQIKLCKLHDQSTNYMLFFLWQLDKIWNFLEQQTDRIIVIFCHGWLTKFVNFFCRRWLTKFVIFCHGWLTKFAYFLLWMTDEVHNYFGVDDWWNSYFFSCGWLTISHFLQWVIDKILFY